MFEKKIDTADIFERKSTEEITIHCGTVILQRQLALDG